MWFEIAAAVFALVALYWGIQYVQHLWLIRLYPAGPFPLPAIGNVHLLAFSRYYPHEVFTNLAQKYGPVFSFSLGMERMVIVNDIHTAKEALVKKGTDFQGRPTTRYELSLLSRGYKGIIAVDYTPQYTFNRNLAHKALRLFGDGMGGSLEEKITVESKCMAERLVQSEEKPVDVRLMMESAVLNVICNILFGSRYNVSDPDFLVVDRFNTLLTSFELRPDIAGVFPWTERFYESNNLKRLKEGCRLRDTFIGKKLKEHEDAFNSEQLRDFCDSLIKSLREDETRWKVHGSDEEIRGHLEMILSDMIIAGTETVSTNLAWAILYILHWPNIQDELYDEITGVMGPNDFPTLKDRPRLPFVSAFIQESMRMATSLHMIAHKAIKANSINGLNIIKDAQVIFNLWGINHDPKEWDSPQTFNPHRWINSEGKCIPGHEKAYLPFGGGRRVCLGEQMAKHELFLFVTRLIKSFKIEPNLKEGFPDVAKGTSGLVFAPLKYTALFVPRDA